MATDPSATGEPRGSGGLDTNAGGRPGHHRRLAQQDGHALLLIGIAVLLLIAMPSMALSWGPPPHDAPGALQVLMALLIAAALACLTAASVVAARALRIAPLRPSDPHDDEEARAHSNDAVSDKREDLCRGTALLAGAVVTAAAGTGLGLLAHFLQPSMF